VSVDRYFRYAQDARDAEKYTRAMQYYDIIIANFNDRPDKVLVAEYEKAYVYYLEKKYTSSLDHLQFLLGKIQVTDPRIVPPALGSLIGLLAEKNEKKLNANLLKLILMDLNDIFSSSLTNSISESFKSSLILGFGSNKSVDVNIAGKDMKIPSLTAFITALEKNSAIRAIGGGGFLLRSSRFEFSETRTIIDKRLKAGFAEGLSKVCVRHDEESRSWVPFDSSRKVDVEQ
jgi:hypothetical protein